MKILITLIIVVGIIVVIYLYSKSQKEKAIIAAQQADLANIIAGGNYQLSSVTSQQGGILGQVSENFGSLAGFFGF